MWLNPSQLLCSCNGNGGNKTLIFNNKRTVHDIIVIFKIYTLCSMVKSKSSFVFLRNFKYKPYNWFTVQVNAITLTSLTPYKRWVVHCQGDSCPAFSGLAWQGVKYPPSQSDIPVMATVSLQTILVNLLSKAYGIANPCHPPKVM